VLDTARTRDLASDVEVTDISVFVEPVTHHFLRNELFNPKSRHNIDGAHAPYFYLRDLFQAQGIEVNTGDYLVRGEKTNRLNVYFSLGIIKNYRELAERKDVILSSFFTMEAPIVAPSNYRELPRISRYFRRIYSYTTPEALTRYGCKGLTFEPFCIPYPYDGPLEQLWSRTDRKFLVMLNYNRLCRRSWQELYTERLRALEYFSQFGEIDLYGLGWDKPPYVVGETWIPATATILHRYLRSNVPFLKRHPFQHVVDRTWRGAAPSKYETQSAYTFTLCYENMMLDGWLNENVFDCFLAGTIPIYLGPPNVTDFIPAECFIDKRQYPTYPELRAYLKSLGPDDIRRYKEAARDFLASTRFNRFKKEAFGQLFSRAVEADTGVRLRHTL